MREGIWPASVQWDLYIPYICGCRKIAKDVSTWKVNTARRDEWRTPFYWFSRCTASCRGTVQCVEGKVGGWSIGVKLPHQSIFVDTVEASTPSQMKVSHRVKMSSILHYYCALFLSRIQKYCRYLLEVYVSFLAVWVLLLLSFCNTVSQQSVLRLPGIARELNENNFF